MTLAEELRALDPTRRVLVKPLRQKHEFVSEMRDLHREGLSIAELHFIGHSGMYGIMFGSTGWPEQFSPHEWREMLIPFAPNAVAYFHACRTARWFAPFFARTFGVTTFGHRLYTTVSTRKDRFAWEARRVGQGDTFPLYIIACVGRKSHGLPGSLRKYLLGTPAQPMTECRPARVVGDPSYDAVASLYDKAFEDIRVRRDEWKWISAHIPTGSRPRVLDIGCGNGALLRALAERIGASVGVDASSGMIDKAVANSRSHRNLRFQTIDGPTLPFADGSFDVVTSFLSFRYLDWDPILKEIHRVLAPRGRFLVVDMVAKPLEPRDALTLVRSAWVHATRPYLDRAFDQNLRTLTSHPAWKKMLEHNPIRAEHEYRWFLESRFPGQKLETLTVGRTQRLVAFDAGPKSDSWLLAPMSFP
ncbi:MAG: class I SAM-dependent methyltransferase [Sandaracinaceae bacterium]|nr:class I SAM-dependent methyltransferase [Sandaracinaceae bacterium]